MTHLKTPDYFREPKEFLKKSTHPPNPLANPKYFRP
jgi:hypothetical protein